MKKNRVTIITSETHEVLVVRAANRNNRRWCPFCSQDVDMVTPQEAATMLGVSTREIFRQLEAGIIHFSEEVGAPLLVCRTSFTTDRTLTVRDSHVDPILKTEDK